MKEKLIFFQYLNYAYIDDLNISFSFQLKEEYAQFF